MDFITYLYLQMKINKKQFANIAFVVLIGLMIYPPTKVFFIRLISFPPSAISKENQQQIQDTDWQLKGLNTNNTNLNKLENNVVFVSFWATWCAPCVAEMPSMQKLFNDYKNQVTFLYVTNENWETVSEFYNKKKFEFPTYNQLTKTPEELKESTIPSTFIIDTSQKIIVKKRGAANWNSTEIRAVLDTLLK